MELFVAMVVAAAAGAMRGFAGVGSGMLMAPFFAVLFGPIETITMIISMELVVTAQLLPGVYRHIDWRVVLPMGIAAAACMPIGSQLLLRMDAQLVTRAIAALVLVFALIMLLGWRYEGRKPLSASIGVGGLSGVLMALTSLGNPPVMLYLLSSRDAAVTNRANFTGYFAVTLVALLVQMMAQSMIRADALVRAATLLPVFMLTAWFGAKAFRAASEALYRRIAFGVLIAAGLYGLLR